MIDPPTHAHGSRPFAPAVELTATEQLELVQACLAQWSSAGDAAPRHIETHISHVLLLGGQAYKIKKKLATSFLDQSTLALRRRACVDELRLNRRLAPDLYLDVVEITGSVREPRLGGAGPVLDVAVKMRVFDQANLWDRLAARGALEPADIDDLAARIARFHAHCEVAPAGGRFGTPAAARAALRDSLHDLHALAARCGWPAAGSAEQAALDALGTWEPVAFERSAPAMAARLAAGRVRECHGDLHLGNVAREGRQALVFDGVEFNEAFRWLDVMDEAAFMTMDLHAHGLPALGHRFLDAYLAQGGDYDGLRVLGYYLVHRALVRAKVAQVRAAQAVGAARDEALAAAARYLRAAAASATPRRPALLVTHGLSGSGKTTLTQSLVEASGAVRVRADVERKRLAGLGPLQSSRSLPGEGLYTPTMNEATQARLLDCAAAALHGGWTVVLDATFIRRHARDEARECARRHGAPFMILRFEAAPAQLRARIRQRLATAGDASEADEAVLQAQMLALEPLQADEWPHTCDAPAGGAPGAELTPDWSAVLARLRAAPG
jgi:hypothetical protein